MTREEYWKKRAEQRLTKAERDSASSLGKIAAQYRKAAQSIEQDICKILDTYRQDFTMEEAKAFLREEIPMAEYNRLKALLPQIQDERFRKELTMVLNAQSYRYRITRMQYMKQLILARLSQAADYEKRTASELYRETVKEGYLRTLYDLQKGVGIGFTVAMLPEKTIDRLESARWYGRNYSASVWRNRGLVAKAAADVVETGILTGQSIQRMTKELMAQTYTHSVSNAARLIRTEVNYFSNQGAYESYKEAGIEEYEYLATLDGRTSPVCRKLDGKTFPLDEAEPGKNYPPMHPYCRSTVIPIIDTPGLKRMEKRAARDPKTGKTVVVDDMTYAQWYNRFVRKDRIFSDIQIQVTPITEKAIQSVPLISPTGWSNSSKIALQQECQAVLSEAQKYPPGTEVGRTYSMEMAPLSDVSVGVPGKGSVRLPRQDEPYITIHNHPDGQIFSHTDIQRFIDSFEMQTMVVVTNSGDVFCLNKTDDYDGFFAMEVWDQQLSKILQWIEKRDLESYLKEILNFLEEVPNYGAQFIKGTAGTAQGNT